MLYYPCLEAEPGNLTASRNAYTTVEPLDITRRRAKLTRRVLPLDLLEPRRRSPDWKGLSGRGVLTKHPSGRTGLYYIKNFLDKTTCMVVRRRRLSGLLNIPYRLCRPEWNLSPRREDLDLAPKLPNRSNPNLRHC